MLQRLVRNANLEGQLYALFGLRLIAPELFPAEAERLKQTPIAHKDQLFPPPNRKVRLASGCLVYADFFQDSIDGIAAGTWDKAFHLNSRTPAP